MGVQKLSAEKKSLKRPVDGVLLLNKPYGVTSNRALQIVKRIFSAAKSGHTGTLDPMATGLLPICFGEATKFSSWLLSADKTYEATIKLGYMSTTGDAEGEITKTEHAEDVSEYTASHCEHVLQQFVGKIMQMPPMYSALKHKGKPLYKYARDGVEVKRQPREVVIYNLRAHSLVQDELKISVRCGTGTYIRTLAEDIGKALGYGGAYLVALCRSEIDRFSLSQTQTIDVLDSMTTEHCDSYLLPVDSLLENLPALTLDAKMAAFLRQGREVLHQFDQCDWSTGQNFRLYDPENKFLGLGEMADQSRIVPKRLLADPASVSH